MYIWVLFVCAMLWATQINYLGLQLVGQRELLKQNGPGMPEQGRTAQSLTEVYHLGHRAEKLFFGFSSILCFPYFFSNMHLSPFSRWSCILPGFQITNIHVIFPHTFSVSLWRKIVLFWLRSAAHCFVWINCSVHTLNENPIKLKIPWERTCS